MNIGVVGLGLIGGSFARDLRSQINVKMYGFDASDRNAETALSLGLVDEVMELSDIITECEVIIIATPVNVIEHLLVDILDKIDTKTTVIDVGSTKSDICQAVSGHTKRSQYVAAHPLAGTEFSGPEAAVKGLFNDKKNIICEKEKSSGYAMSTALKIFESLGMKTFYLSPEEHDKHLAYVSHLSHVSSFMLGLTVLDIEKDENQIFNLASTGFASTVRLAKSNPQTWTAIFSKNRKYVKESLDEYIAKLQRFSQALAEDDTSTMSALMREANDIKRVLQ